MPIFRHLATRRTGAVEYLTLNRPDVRNAFNDAVIAELTAYARNARADRGLRVVVLAGAGKAFSAGADLEWMSRTLAYTRHDYQRDSEALQAMLEQLDTLPQALVGRIHGAAIAGGTGLTAVCDVAIAAENAMFGFSEVRLGIVPALISPYVIAKIGASAARALFVTGRRFDAAQAREIGLVHQVVPAERLDAAVDECVRGLLACGPEAVAAAKALVAAVAGRAPAAVAAETAAVIAERRASAEGQAGLRAFLQKQPPPWAK
jgi:methylglutaconyl-CoA hydratase